MIDQMPLILAAALVTYLTRICGFALAGRTVPPAVDRFLTMIPIAAFAALAAPDLVTGVAPTARVLAAIAAGAVTVVSRKVWLGLLAGMALFLAVRALGVS